MPKVTGSKAGKVVSNGQATITVQNAPRLAWETTDGQTARLWQGNVEDALRLLPSKSVHCVVTSPPYWGLRDYQTGDGNEIGKEKTPQEFVARMVSVFSEVYRVLRDDGTLWLNLGDTYHDKGNMAGIPWRVAFALQDAGWVLRQDIIWCLSGGTWVYVRSQKGDMPMMIRDMARLDPSTIKLWNGEKWTQVLGMSVSKRKGTELELVLRSGERISCTPNHQFPTERGLLQASEIKVGDRLQSCTLPEPDNIKEPEHITNEAAWLAGLYLAEGCGVDTGNISISGHANEIERWNRVRPIVESYGGVATLRVKGNNQTISIWGKVVCAVIRELISGDGAKYKAFSPVVWRYGNTFIESLMNGYLSGDGSNRGNERWRLGFTRNSSLERDIRTACARLGWRLTLKQTVATIDGVPYPAYRGELCKTKSGHWNEKDRNEVVEIRKARCREVYDIGVEDEPHLFALASGVLTHNSKPSCMPESVKNRCTKAHEYVFMLTKGMKYYFDMEAIKEETKPETVEKCKASIDKPSNRLNYKQGQAVNVEATTTANPSPNGAWADAEKLARIMEGSNKRSVWSVSHGGGYRASHFATFPPKLIEPCILAGTSAKGCCAECGAPWRRVVERERKATRPGTNSKATSRSSGLTGGLYNPPGQAPSSNARIAAEQGNRDPQRHVTTSETVGWEPGCTCYEGNFCEPVPCIVLDPFVGSGTAVAVAMAHGRVGWGIDLSLKYLLSNAVPRIEGELIQRPAMQHLIPARGKS